MPCVNTEATEGKQAALGLQAVSSSIPSCFHLADRQIVPPLCSSCRFAAGDKPGRHRRADVAGDRFVPPPTPECKAHVRVSTQDSKRTASKRLFPFLQCRLVFLSPPWPLVSLASVRAAWRWSGEELICFPIEVDTRGAFKARYNGHSKAARRCRRVCETPHPTTTTSPPINPSSPRPPSSKTHCYWRNRRTKGGSSCR